MAYKPLKDENYNNLKGINEKFSEYVTEPGQLLDIRNYGFERPGALVSRPGTSDFASLPRSLYPIAPRGLYEYVKSTGFSLLVYDIGDKLYKTWGSQVGQSLTPNVTTSYGIDFQTYNDFLYYANGYSSQRFDASFSVFYGVPKQRSFITGGGVTFNTSLGTGVTYVIPSGSYVFRYSPVKYGPTYAPTVGQRVQDDETGVNLEFITSIGSTIVSQGQWGIFGFTIPPGYGVSSILPYKIPPGASSYLQGPTIIPFTLTPQSDGITLYHAFFPEFTVGGNFTQNFFFTLVPRYLEVYNNMFFMSGFSTSPSTVWYSNLADPDEVDEENFFDVRTSNGDVITNMIVFQGTMVIFKYRSVHELSGSSPEDLSLKDMNLNYGCVNSTAAITFNNKLWFMDQKGICEYNGPNTFIVSYPVESALNSVDKSTCRAFYIKKRNEVWFVCSGVAFVYDTQIGSWTIYDKLQINASVGANILNFGATTKDLSYSESGQSFIQFTRFDDTVHTDRGQAITLSIKTRFHKRLGDSTQEMWRRFYLNNDISGASLGVTLNFYPDYGTSIYESRTTNLSEFQTRIDFGISAKSLSIEIILKASEQISINGYTIESRYLRSV